MTPFLQIQLQGMTGMFIKGKPGSMLLEEVAKNIAIRSTFKETCTPHAEEHSVIPIPLDGMFSSLLHHLILSTNSRSRQRYRTLLPFYRRKMDAGACQ